MNVTIFRQALAQTWRPLVITTGALAAMLLLGLWAYQGIDLSFYDSLPQAMRAVLGIPEGADAALMAYNEMLGSIGALAFVGVAIATGARLAAADEQRKTLSLVLTAPVSRVSFALSKAAAGMVVVGVAGVALWGLAELAPRLLGIASGQAQVGALMVHLVACALFHASLSYAVSACTGSSGLGSGTATVVMLGGWLGTGLLSLSENTADLVDYLPWSWFSGAQPLIKGIDGGDLGLLLGGAVILCGVGIAVFSRREIGLPTRRLTLPKLSLAAGQKAQGGSLFAVELAAQQRLVLIVSALSVFLALPMAPLYQAMADELVAAASSFPKTMLALFGGGDLSTLNGFLHLEVLGMMAPISVILVAVAAANAGIAGHEQAGRLSLILSAPVSRRRIYLTTVCVMVISVAVTTLATLVALWAGVKLSGLPSEGHFVEAGLLLACLGWCFGAIALALSASSGKTALTRWGTTAVAVVSYFGYTLLDAIDREQWAWWSPFKAYLTGPVLETGLQWWQPTLFGGIAVVALLIGYLGLCTRDLR